MTPQEALVALNLLPRIGPVRVRKLIDFCGSAEAVLNAPQATLRQVDGIGEETANTISHWENQIDLARELREVEQRGISIITQKDASYPEALKNSYNPPLVLYVWGELKSEDRHAIAVVGSRKTTHYGTNTARQLSFQLASNGMTIISGLARGIDSFAHEGAIAANGRTIAVLGSGLAQLYPAENMPLAEKIADGHGAVISEFPLHTRPTKQTFPMRNRVVAAWSQGVLVVECAEWSGARITANLAVEMGRPIFAVPGQIDRATSAGCHALIREGATLVTSGQDILNDLSFLPFQESKKPKNSEKPPTNTIPNNSLPPLSPEEQLIIESIGPEELLIDEILAKTSVSLPELNAILQKLEIIGRIKKRPGNRFSNL